MNIPASLLVAVNPSLFGMVPLQLYIILHPLGYPFCRLMLAIHHIKLFTTYVIWLTTVWPRLLSAQPLLPVLLCLLTMRSRSMRSKDRSPLLLIRNPWQILTSMRIWTRISNTFAPSCMLQFRATNNGSILHVSTG
jgi:hypothetical protein